MITYQAGEEQAPIVLARVCCHVEGCENAEIHLNVPVEAIDPHVVCGPCGNTITDIAFLDE